MDIEILKISDVDVSSTLYTLGIPIDGIFSSGQLNRFNEPVMECYFKKTPEIDKTIDNYYSDTLKVNPRVLLSNRKEIISRIKNAQHGKDA